MASSSSSYSATRIALTTTGVLATAFVAYAAYFDYRRRNDPVFRKKLVREQKKVHKIVQQQEQVGRAQVVAALKRALALINAEPIPSDVEAREQFFMEQVAMGEQLAARTPEFYVASAISFYKALKVYPAPQELIMIYQKTQPPPVFDLVMELISLEMSSSTGSRDPRDANPSEDALLTEIDDVAPSPSAPASNSSSSAAGTAGSTTGGASPSSGGSFVVVEGETEAEGEKKNKDGETPALATATAVKSDDPPEPVLGA